jgi:Homeodomain-like domain
MAKKYRVTLMPEERQELQALIAKGKASARKLAHARVLLPVDEAEAQAGRPDEETAAALHLSVRTVERVGERFVEQGFAAALLPLPSKRVYARTFDGASEARLIALACGAPPEGKSRWTLPLLAEQWVELQVLDTVSRECVRQALKKTNASRTGERGGAFRPSSRRSLFATWKMCWRCTIDRRIRSARWCAWTKPSGN